MKWSRKHAARRAAEAAQLREQAERAEAEAHAHIVVPLRKMRQQNHVVEDIIHIIRKGGTGEPAG